MSKHKAEIKKSRSELEAKEQEKMTLRQAQEELERRIAELTAQLDARIKVDEVREGAYAVLEQTHKAQTEKLADTKKEEASLRKAKEDLEKA
eukprot:790981-Rhodomonas_salina.1